MDTRYSQPQVGGGMERCSLEAEKDKDQAENGFDSVQEDNSLPVPQGQNLK